MLWEFIRKEGNGRLILIFGGWSTEPSFYKDLTIEGWDILAVTSYTDFQFPLSLLEEYHTVVLFAWSLGVIASYNCIPKEKISFAIAINGTICPVSDEYGIPEEIFKGTKDYLTERNLIKFRKRMCGPDYEDVKDRFSQNPDIAKLKKELQFIEDYSKAASTLEGKGTEGKYFNRVYISEEDRIFPSSNQLREWTTHYPGPDIIMLPTASHLPDLKRIIRSLLLPRKKIGEKFHKAFSSYDINAHAQKKIAHTLAEMSPDNRCTKIVEIGPGTGYFSRLIAGKLKPETIDYIELYPFEKFGVAERENIVVEDAEEWIFSQAKQIIREYDAIVSASAIQWFVNPELFFANSAKILKKDGFLLLSTFGPENLNELALVNPHRILYRDTDELLNMLKKYFEDVKVTKDFIRLDFQSTRELLMHLKETGVGASEGKQNSVKVLHKTLPTHLTYAPIYIVATRPI